MPAWHRRPEPTGLAPDGAEIRELVGRAQGATGLSVAEALVLTGERTAKVYHRTVYEEVWYIVRGAGAMHLHRPGAPDEEIFPVGVGDAVLIPPGHGFWVENTGAGDLIFLCCGSPPWPGDDEARPWPT
jgi:mannose-6-phosphate isomerase-like protein (cupin superfamily)